MAKQYTFFWKTESPFSQWHPSTYTCNGIQYSSAEQGMMHGKALLFADKATAQLILATTSPRKIKALGRKIQGFDEATWEKHRRDIVLQNNLAKFTQHDSLHEALQATHDSHIVEASPYDAIWGIGLDEATARVTPETEWPGLNLLGEVLMRVRAVIQKDDATE